MVRLLTSLLVALAYGAAPASATASPQGREQEAGERRRVVSVGTAPTLEARSVTGSVDLDGLLDDAVWQQAEQGSGFVQREPFQGEAATERTLVQIIYTEDTLYIGIRALDREPDRIIATEMQRDGALSFRGGRLDSGDSVSVLLDTFLDRRNAFYFETNPLGARADALITDEGRDKNYEWDGVWDTAARRTEEGWSAEFAIPFNTLRFDPALDTWGLNVRRLIRRKSEQVNWAPILREADMFRVSQFGQLTGLAGARPARNLRVKPYVVASGDEGIDTPVGNVNGDADVGLDVRWGVTDSLTLDVTVNTDFAQVEADEQRVNLTRFSLFFPEKREFFLENAGIFEFGPSGGGRGGGGGGGFAPLLKVYHSRRIGIDGGDVIPILAGGKMTGRAGKWNIGLLNVQTSEQTFPQDDGDDDIVPSTNWAVARIKRNVGERSSVGMIFTNRQSSGTDYNRVWGLDADFNPHPRFGFGGYFTSSDNPGDDGENWAAGARASWRGPVWRWSAGWDEVRENYDPGVGFLLRRGVRRFNPQITFEPRPESIGWIRNFSWEFRNTVITNTDGTLETYNGAVRLFAIRTQSEDWISFGIQPKFELLHEPFEIQEGIIIAPGEYTFHDWGMFLNTSSGRPVTAFVRLNAGEFFDGTHFNANATVNIRPSPYFRSETEWNRNDVSLPAGSFITNVLRQRFNVSLSPNLSVNSFIQYSDVDQLLSMNTRFNWIYRPGADLFIVYNQNWFDGGTQDRALIFKFTYLWAL